MNEFQNVEGFRSEKEGSLFKLETKETKKGQIVTEETLIANHSPHVVAIKKIDDGTEIKEQLETILVRDFKQYPFSMNTENVYSQYPNKNFGAACVVYPTRNAIPWYRLYIQLQCASVPVLVVYQHTGIKEIDGKRVFLNGKNSVTAEGLTKNYTVELESQLENYGFVETKHENRYLVLWDLFKLVPFSIAIVCIGYVFDSPLYPLLREIGIEPGFALYLVGKTGSHKTSLAKLLLNFFGSFDYSTPSPAGFRDTVSSIEKKMSCADGAVLLVDDRIPTATGYIKNQMEQVEQAILRLVGDKASRGRMYADGSLRKNYRPRAGVIITGEDGLQNVSESGVARAFTVEMQPDTVNLDVLTELQGQAYCLNEVMSEFIQYVLQKWDDLKAILYEHFIEYRREAQSVGHGRLAEAVAHLRLAIEVMCAWLESIGQINKKLSIDLQSRAAETFIALAKEQEKRVVADKPTKLYLDAIRQMMETGKAITIPAKGSNTVPKDGMIGYHDNDYYYLIPDSAYNAVCKFYREQDKTFPLSKTRIHEHLVEEGIAKRGKGQITMNVRCCGKQGGKLVLYRSKVDITEGSEEE